MTSITRKLTEEDAKASKRLKAHWNAKKGELGLTQNQIAETLGITQGMFSLMLNGHVAIPKYLLLRISKILKINPSTIDPSVEEDLIEVQDKVSKTAPMYIQIPILFTLDNNRPKDKFVEVSIKSAPKNGYAMEVDSDRYAPLIRRGTIAVIDPNLPIDKEDRVFVRLKNHSNILAIFDRFESGKFYFTTIVPGAPLVEEGYDEADVITLHYISEWREPKKKL